MPSLKSLLKDTAIYGISSIVGRFLNYLMVPLYTYCMPKESGDYGVSVNIYGWVALTMVILTFGMETTLFRFANNGSPQQGDDNPRHWPDTVFTTALATVGALTAIFLVILFATLTPVSTALGYSRHPEYLAMMAIVVALDALQAIPFAYLRFQKRPVRFAALKLLFIVLSIALNIIFFLVLRRTEVFYVFAINLACTTAITLLFLPDMCRIHWHFDAALLRRMLAYSWPLLILGIAGILNQTFDKIFFPIIYKGPDAEMQLGIYGACVKIAMIMAMITQAFRYAYEPMVFSIARQGDSKHTYALGMEMFIGFTLLAFLCVEGYIDILQFIIGPGYSEGLRVVPIVMVAEIMMGVYFNLSFWYKLIDKTIYGAWFSIAGCAALVAVNVLFIPTHSYMACAWGGVAGYGTAMVLSYIVGQRKNPIAYPMARITGCVAAAAILYAAMAILPATWPLPVRLTLNTLLIIAYAAHVWFWSIRRLHR